MSLPIPKSPAEVVEISPEALEIANTYLEFQDITKTAEALGITTDMVSSYLTRREIRSYIDNVFMDVGYNNRFKLRGIMDAVIARKLMEMDEAEIGSSKDIIEILQLSHKMSMDYLDRQIKLEELKQKNTVKNQTNVQINDTSGSNNYMTLLEKLAENKK